MTKHMREVTQLAKSYGPRVETARSGHLRIVRPNGSYVCAVSGSPSRSRVIRDVERTIKLGLAA